MKHFQLLLIFIALSLFFVSCEKKEEDPNEQNPNCPPPSLNVSPTSDGGFYISYSSSAAYGFFEVQYGPNGFELGNGTTVTSNGDPITGLNNGTYDVYMRGNCGGNEWSNWDGPSSVLVTGGGSSSCPQPADLDQYWSSYDYRMIWDGESSHNYYEVEYGATGFNPGEGTLATVNGTSYSKGVFTQGTTYDFYVRANCGGDDWSSWAGPESFYADRNANRCLKPLGISANRVGSYIEVDIEPNGESKHEVNFNNANYNDTENIHTQTQTNGTYGTFYTNVTYYVWARSVCEDGSKTDWVGPVVIN